MKLENGNPTMEGRYVAYVPGLVEWLTPVIVTWSRGAWFYLHSTQKFEDDVRCWIGPLPVLKHVPFADPKPPLEYDL